MTSACNDRELMMFGAHVVCWENRSFSLEDFCGMFIINHPILVEISTEHDIKWFSIMERHVRKHGAASPAKEASFQKKFQVEKK